MRCAAFELRTLLGGCGGGICAADVIPRMLSLQVKVKTDGWDWTSAACHILTPPQFQKGRWDSFTEAVRVRVRARVQCQKFMQQAEGAELHLH